MIMALWSRFVLRDTGRGQSESRSSEGAKLSLQKSRTASALPENAHRGVSRHLHVGFVHKHSLETGVRVSAGQDLLVKLKDLVQEGHGVLEQRQQLRQAEVRHLSREDR